MQLTQALLEDSWTVTANESDICDLTTPDEMGRIDALLGMPCEPTNYFCKLGDVEMYIIAWREVMDALPALHVDIAGELADLQEGMEEEAYLRSWH